MSINVIRLFRLCCFYTRECTGFNNIGAQGVFFAEWVNSQWSDQSDHDIRIWWHGWAASEQRLQATPPFSSLRLRLARFFFAPLHMTACSQAKLSFVSSSDVSVFRTLPMHLSVLIIFILFFFRNDFGCKKQCFYLVAFTFRLRGSGSACQFFHCQLALIK